MSAEVVLRPGLAPLADWRAIYRGAAVSLDPVARADVEAGAAAIERIAAQGDGRLARSGNGAPTLAEISQDGGTLPAAVTRLFVALKLASLAQGMSGVRWSVIQAVEGLLANDTLPGIPAGNADDRIALSHLFAALTGAGESGRREERTSLRLEPHERWALVSGAQLSTASALAGLFEAERLFQSALVAAALSFGALGGASAPLHPRVHRLLRQPGQIDVGHALRALRRPNGAHAAAKARNGGHANGTRSTPFKMGACLDLLRQAGETLEKAANAVSEDRLVLWQTEEVVPGAEDSSSAVIASDLIALALREIGDLSERRIAALTGSAEPAGANGEEDRTAPPPRAAAFAAENRERAAPVGFDAAGVRRLLPMAGTTALVLAVEFISAAKALRAQPERAGGPLAGIESRLGEVAGGSASGDDWTTASTLAATAELVRSGALAAVPGVDLPAAVPPPGRSI